MHISLRHAGMMPGGCVMLNIKTQHIETVMQEGRILTSVRMAHKKIKVVFSVEALVTF